MDLSAVPLKDAITISLSVAVVIMAETLLAENNFAQKNRYRINDNQELLAFSLGNFAAALTGCCPINGSVSRTAMGEQYQGKTQLTGIVAGISMMILLLCGTGFIGFLPVPVLTAIVISALLGATEFELAVRLWKVSRTECLIFFGAFFGVLLLGTINGVLIGIMLSFTEMIIRTAKPARCFLGIQTGHSHFRDLKESSSIHAVEHVVIYRFSSNLCFANVSVLQKDIEDAIREDTRAVILDAGGIGSIDITAADRLEMMAENFERKGIKFYITEHSENVNEQMRKLGIGHLIEEGKVRRTILAALQDAGIPSMGTTAGADKARDPLVWMPWQLEIPAAVHAVHEAMVPAEEENTLEEFAWAFGDDAVEEMEKKVHQVMEQIHKLPDLERLADVGFEEKLKNWHSLGVLDEDEILRRMEMHLDELPENLRGDRKVILQLIEKRRRKIEQQLLLHHPEIVEHLKKSRERLEKRLEKQNPEAARKLHEWEVQIREKEEE